MPMRANKLSSYRTTVSHKNGNTTVTYVNTPIVEFDRECIVLRTGGWKSVTTKRKMNQAARQFDLPYGVTQRAGDWFVISGADGSQLPFDSDEIVLDRNTGLAHVA